MLRFAAAVLLVPYLAWLTRAFVGAPAYAAALMVAADATRSAMFFYVHVFPLALVALAVAWWLRRINLLVTMGIGAMCSALYLLPYALDLGSDKIIPWLKYKVGDAVVMELVFGSAVGALVWLLGVWRNPSLRRASGGGGRT